MVRTFHIILEHDEDGWIVASCPELPGCVSQGRTVAEAMANVHEAIQVSLETRRKHGLPIDLAEVRELTVEVPA